MDLDSDTQALESMYVVSSDLMAVPGRTVTIHRWGHMCHTSPHLNTRTDLGYACVDHDLVMCPRCDWPEGTAEFIRSRGAWPDDDTTNSGRRAEVAAKGGA